MKKAPFYILIAAVTLFLGLVSVQIIVPLNLRLYLQSSNAVNEEIIVQIEQPLAVVNVQAVDRTETEESANPLERVWVEGDFAEYGRVSVARVCEPDEFDWVKCKLTIREKGKVRKTFEIERDNRWWLRFGFFDFLGKGDKQLVVHSYSGGAHCCFDYVIFDFEPRFRVIYDSSKHDSANEIGYELVPVDINSDGIFEFHRRVENFAYFHASYADSNKPTALFAYSKKRGTYDLANSRFPEFILGDTQRMREWFEKENVALDERFMARETFLNYVFSGNESRAWEYFDKNYNFEDKEEYRRDVKKLFRSDPTYLSIYGKGGK